MNTPAHLVLSALLLGRGERRGLWLPITAGALLPDLPMVGFYAYQRVVLENPERTIWSQIYFEPGWQVFFDLFNSLPLIAIGLLVAWRFRSRAWFAFFLSIGLHCIVDLVVHHDDAHAHLFPISSWHFRSPVSYWDPRFYGQIFAVAEAAFVLVGCAFLVRRSSPRSWRVIGAVTLLVYLGAAAFVITVWLPSSS